MTHFAFVFLSACILCYLCCMKKNEDYQGFVDKFKPKKTTDDCYTPKPVYDVVLAWVDKHVGIKGRKVVRPFYQEVTSKTIIIQRVVWLLTILRLVLFVR